jgi:hypothetical protein
LILPSLTMFPTLTGREFLGPYWDHIWDHSQFTVVDSPESLSTTRRSDSGMNCW